MPAHTRPEAVLDLVGVGVGPSNLSLAALAEPVADLSTVFLEAKPAFRWHPGLLDGAAVIQTSFLKDLVTPIDPTSRYSFLNFLRETGRLYRFLVADFPHVSRLEYEQYYRWVARQLQSLRFKATVDALDLDQDLFAVQAGGQTTHARNIVLGTGPAPRIPACARGVLGPDVFHASCYDQIAPELAGRRVAVVGGGQSGAEMFLRLLQPGRCRPCEVAWISSRPNFLPLDDTPFTNELFFPNYVTHFRGLSSADRRRTLEEQRLASDGIGEGTLSQIYQRLYALDFLEEPWLRHRLLPGHRMVALARRADGLELVAEGTDRSLVRICADLVLLCTGYAYERPECLAPIADRIRWSDGAYRVSGDFSIEWDGPRERRIYVQNAARHSHGIADPNLSLAAWRSAVIVNSVCRRPVYDTGDCSAAIQWSPEVTTAAQIPTQEFAK
ncbi:MAG: L-lysine 6-monooxygenase [Candidatus Nephthysia bennettiae]|uniref:L-lysine N6-monooxygenase MbtG n=1 Tax=Candidatus Nephthysia bennettiae TaxID=3127016 RepID=A0A934N8B7_9BACT|nr:SidA/IucD/PvdA family monooxygenase [Candidatus Dormibacteraeota bacterium]MBJ7610775.1 SidA/IucD/PvdA family monooxygenase [Candidatus Dormibacteraeota bacterium]PZR87454.1 MAG: L-lysine 6-monooxygenase [Candidatus Dormibacteraeota bacterium]